MRLDTANVGANRAPTMTISFAGSYRHSALLACGRTRQAADRCPGRGSACLGCSSKRARGIFDTAANLLTNLQKGTVCIGRTNLSYGRDYTLPLRLWSLSRSLRRLSGRQGRAADLGRRSPGYRNSPVAVCVPPNQLLRMVGRRPAHQCYANRPGNIPSYGINRQL